MMFEKSSVSCSDNEDIKPKLVAAMQFNEDVTTHIPRFEKSFRKINKKFNYYYGPY